MNNDQHPLAGCAGAIRTRQLLHGYDRRVQEKALRGKVALVLLTLRRQRERTVKHMKDACDGIVACE